MDWSECLPVAVAAGTRQDADRVLPVPAGVCVHDQGWTGYFRRVELLLAHFMHCAAWAALATLASLTAMLVTKSQATSTLPTQGTCAPAGVKGHGFLIARVQSPPFGCIVMHCLAQRQQASVLETDTMYTTQQRVCPAMPAAHSIQTVPMPADPGSNCSSPRELARPGARSTAPRCSSRFRAQALGPPSARKTWRR